LPKLYRFSEATFETLNNVLSQGQEAAIFCQLTFTLSGLVVSTRLLASYQCLNFYT